MENTTNIQITDWIQAFSAIAALIVSVIAIYYSWKSIKLSEKSIKEANRPVVSIYLDYIYVNSSLHEYLIIKNFGETTAKVDSINIDKEIYILKGQGTIFSQSLPFTLAPNQSFSTVLRNNAFDKNEIENIYKFDITYSDFTDTYKDSFIINQHLVKDMKFVKSNPSKRMTSSGALMRVTEEMLRKNL